METTRLGRTNMQVSRSGFGCIPIQRLSQDDAVALVRKAYDNGINFFDTARGYSDSEVKLGAAFADVRKNLILATKTHSSDEAAFFTDLETSLRNLRTDYIDIYQLHNPSFDVDEGHVLYQSMLKAKAQGKIRAISITSHKLDAALRAVSSGLFDTMQFPLSCLSSDEDMVLSALCKQHDVGLIAMKAMSGGLITNPNGSFAFLRSFDNIVPIWGIQHAWELEQFLALERNPPALDEALWAEIHADRTALSGNFCRGCGYCQPTCPANIQIGMASRMSLLMRRSVEANYRTPQTQAMMENITECTHCEVCLSHCPYGLNPPEMLERELALYRKAIAQ